MQHVFEDVCPSLRQVRKHVFEADEKRELAARIADHYERAGLPRFYVMTVFSETRPEDMYVGGEQADAGVYTYWLKKA